jgi:hypothetical protein
LLFCDKIFFRRIQTSAIHRFTRPCISADKNGITPLHNAVLMGYKDVMALLLDKGADVNARDCNNTTPLHYAAMADKAMVAMLLEKGADVNAKDFFGQTPLSIAFQAANKDVIKLLLDKGADDTGIGAAIMIEKNTPAKTLPTVPWCEVTSHPEKHIDERIRVRAIFRTGFEWSEIYSLDCVDSKSTWLEFSPMVKESSSRKTLKQIEPDAGTAFFSITVGIVLEGRLTGIFGVTQDHGYGHLGRYDLQFTTDRVVSAERLDTKGFHPKSLLPEDRKRIELFENRGDDSKGNGVRSP